MQFEMLSMIRRAAISGVWLLAAGSGSVAHGDDRPWSEIENEARGQTVYFHAWGGDQKINAYLQWAARMIDERYRVDLRHVKTDDIGNVITLLLAEKAAGRVEGGRIDLMWINGENFHALRDAGLLFGPFAERLPNYALVDTDGKPATVIDFTLPTEGFEAPWGLAQLTLLYDSARVNEPPRSTVELLEWARSHPGRMTYPAPPDFIGTTFLKQVLIEHVADAAMLGRAPSEREFAIATEPLWRYLDALHPSLWRSGRTFPLASPALRQLLSDNEVDIALTFNPAEATASIAAGLLPPTVRALILDGGTIANAHFLAISFNANAKEGAMVTANFLLSAEAQARKADPRIWGDLTVLDLDRLSRADQALFEGWSRSASYPTVEELATTRNEPHPEWTTRLERAWLTRYGR